MSVDGSAIYAGSYFLRQGLSFVQNCLNIQTRDSAQLAISASKPASRAKTRNRCFRGQKREENRCSKGENPRREGHGHRTGLGAVTEVVLKLCFIPFLTYSC